MKRLLSIILISCLIALMAACGKSGLNEVSAALNKTNEAKSMSYRMDVSGDFSFTGFDESIFGGVTAEQVEEMLNEMSIVYNGKSLTDKEAGKLQSEMEFSIGVMGMEIETKMWSRYSDDGKSVESIVQIPQLPGLFESEKPYTVTRTTIQDSNKEADELITNILNDFIVENVNDEKFFTKLEDRHYKIHADKDKCVSLMKDIIETMLSNSEGLASTAGMSIEDQYDNIMKVIPLILGESGIDIEIIIGDDGYVSKEIFTIDINLDISEIEEAMEQDSSGMQGVIGMKMVIDMEFDDYNSIETIDFPEVSEDNAIINEF